MTDEIDRAQALEEQLRADALREQARRAALAGKTVADSAARCVACGEPIPLARRRAVPGCQRCVTCEVAAERGFLKGLRDGD
ncbi:MAG: hypothetical protein Fur0019_16120 [Tibeticola sp.]